MSPEPTTQTTKAPLTMEEAFALLNRFPTKKLRFGIAGGDGRTLDFEIRGPSQEERDQADQAGMQITGGRRPDLKVKSVEMRRELVRLCVVKGPDGWGEKALVSLPPDMLDELASAIDGFSALEPETFRGLR